MARSHHARYDAAERFERKAARRQQPRTRRQGTRTAIVAAAAREAVA